MTICTSFLWSSSRSYSNRSETHSLCLRFLVAPQSFSRDSYWDLLRESQCWEHNHGSDVFIPGHKVMLMFHDPFNTFMLILGVLSLRQMQPSLAVELQNRGLVLFPLILWDWTCFGCHSGARRWGIPRAHKKSMQNTVWICQDGI